jgi:hypothetical protein
MFIVWGQRMYAKVDRVPGVLYVATLFFHLMYLPLIPVGGIVVAARDSRAGSIPMSWKSILVAYLRVIMAPFAFVGVLMLLPSAKSTAVAALTGLAMVAAFVALMVVPGRIKPSYERARELGDAVGLYADEWEQVDALYGQSGRGADYLSN